MKNKLVKLAAGLSLTLVFNEAFGGEILPPQSSFEYSVPSPSLVVLPTTDVTFSFSSTLRVDCHGDVYVFDSKTPSVMDAKTTLAFHEFAKTQLHCAKEK